MALVFKTKVGSEAVELAGVGLLGPNGVGGKLVSVAAAQMSELMDESQASVEHPRGVPLEGEELQKAAEAFAQERGLEVVDVPDDELAALNVGIGSAGATRPAVEIAEEEARRENGELAAEAKAAEEADSSDQASDWQAGAPAQSPAAPAASDPAQAPAAPASGSSAASTPPASTPPATPAAPAAPASGSGTTTSSASSAA